MPLTAADLQARVGADVSGLQTGLKQASGELKGFATTGKSDLAGLGQAMTSLNPQAAMLTQAMRYGIAGGALFAGVQIAGATGEMARMGAEIERLDDKFSLFYSGGALSQLRAATKGAIDDQDLMLMANRAHLLGVGKDVDELSKLWAVAIERGAGVGKSALQSVNAVTNGIGRNSAMILDDIAVVGLGEASYQRYATILGKTVDQLTEMEQKQALVNDIMAMGGGESGGIGKTALAFERLDTAMANIKARGAVGLADLLGPGVTELSDMLNLLSVDQEALARTTDSLEEFHDKLREGKEALNQSALGLLLSGIPVVNASLGMKQLTDAQVAAIQEQERLNAVIAALPKADVEWMNADFVMLEQQQYRVGAAFFSWVLGLPGQIMNVVGAAQALDAQIAGIVGQISGQVAGMVVRGQASPDQAQKWLAQYTSGLMEIQNRAGISEAERRWQLDLYRAKWNQTLSDVVTGFTRVRDAATSAFETMRSDLQSIFAPTQNADFTNQLDAMGRHIDTWDEQARRMADVANRGMDSPWAKMLNIPPEVAAQGNDAVKAFAIQWQQSFYAGMMPQEINMQSVIDKYRQMLTSRANWEAIFKAAEQAIRDQGLTFNQELFDQTVSGMTGGAAGTGAGAGSAITAGMPAAFSANPISAMIKTSFDADMAGQGRETLRLIGLSSAGTIIGGMKEGFKNAAFLKMMADAVAPGVWEWIQAQQSRKPGGSQ